MVFVVVFFTLLLPLLRSQLPQLPFPSDKIISIEGTLIADATPLRGGRFLYRIKINSATSNMNMTASSKGAIKVISRGDSLYKGSLVKVVNPRFDVDYNYLNMLFFNPLPMVNSREVILLKESKQSYYRNKVAKPIFAAIEKIDAGDGLVSALLTGNRIDLDPMLSRNIRKSGCAHILALSGMHLGIITMFVLFLFRKIVGGKKAIIAAFVFNFFFALFAGMSVPLLRSFIFFSIINFAKITGRVVDIDKLFVLSYAITVLLAPDEAGDLSFHYSFLAMAGIIFYCPYLYRVFLGIAPPVLASQLAFTIAAQLPTLVLSSIVFGELYSSGIVASIIISFLVTIFMLTAFPGVIIILFTDIPVVPISFLIKMLSSLIHRCAAFFASFPVFKPNSIAIFILIIINFSVILLVMFPYLKNEKYKILNFCKRFK
ncbi:MAG: ComEC/Rec2 family competence protein [Spirochaetaceae bacterium]|nr:ComEC/Rec2 family competence protein [Spirochaetaceae bacterium]